MEDEPGTPGLIETISASMIEPILHLNNANTPHVNALTRSMLETLIEMADGAWVSVDEHGALAGFALVMGPGKPYESLNYRWFEQSFLHFHYLDRIVVTPSHRRLGEEKKAIKVESKLGKLGAAVEPPSDGVCLLPAVSATVVAPVFPPGNPRSWEAQVTVRCKVSARGEPESCSAVGGWGRVGAFESAALTAVEAWTWFPALENGNPVASQRTVDVAFVLH